MAILFADIGGSTSLFQRAGDVEAHQLIADSLSRMSQAVESANGELLRTVGDAVLAKFSSCDAACLAATNIQFAHRDTLLAVRVGFHWGKAIDHQGDVYGNAVNIAARVSGLANTKEIITTQEAVNRLTDLPAGNPQLLDTMTLKGVEKPIGIYRIPWEPNSNSTENLTQVYTQLVAADHSGVNINLELTTADKTITLNASSGACTIGRSSDNSLQATHTAASRLHSKIEFNNGKFVLEDLSTNGTYVIKNGQPFVFVHRDTITLDGSGIINTGFLPGEETNEDKSIHYVTQFAID